VAVATEHDSTAAAPVHSARPANDAPQKSAPELAGEAVRRVMRTLEENPEQDPIALLARELEEIESERPRK
jgi:hypothetical protein